MDTDDRLAALEARLAALETLTIPATEAGLQHALMAESAHGPLEHARLDARRSAIKAAAAPLVFDRKEERQRRQREKLAAKLRDREAAAERERAELERLSGLLEPLEAIPSELAEILTRPEILRAADRVLVASDKLLASMPSRVLLIGHELERETATKRVHRRSEVLRLIELAASRGSIERRDGGWGASGWNSLGGRWLAPALTARVDMDRDDDGTEAFGLAVVPHDFAAVTLEASGIDTAKITRAFEAAGKPSLFCVYALGYRPVAFGLRRGASA